MAALGTIYSIGFKNKNKSLYKLGHGQAFSATHKYIYAIANDHLLRHSSQSEEIMQISKKDLQIKRIWIFKIWNKSAKDGRYMHNATFLNDNKLLQCTIVQLSIVLNIGKLPPW
jgi:hypothetical protein